MDRVRCRKMGFESGDFITVSCENGKLVITPDAEKAVLVQAEAIFMEKKMKKIPGTYECKLDGYCWWWICFECRFKRTSKYYS